jgi:hypothetical protein
MDLFKLPMQLVKHLCTSMYAFFEQFAPKFVKNM